MIEAEIGQKYFFPTAIHTKFKKIGGSKDEEVHTFGEKMEEDFTFTGGYGNVIARRV